LLGFIPGLIAAEAKMGVINNNEISLMIGWVFILFQFLILLIKDRAIIYPTMTQPKVARDENSSISLPSKIIYTPKINAAIVIPVRTIFGYFSIVF